MLHSGQRYSTAIQQINFPVWQGKQNPFHGMFYFVGSIPSICYDQAAQKSLKYETEADAIRAAIAGGASCIQGTDCRIVEPMDYI